MNLEVILRIIKCLFLANYKEHDFTSKVFLRVCLIPYTSHKTVFNVCCEELAEEGMKSC